MVVTFQENAGLILVLTFMICEKCWSYQQTSRKNSVMKGERSSDRRQSPSHKRDVVNEHRQTKHDHFMLPVIVPLNMMSNVQVVDRHMVSITRSLYIGNIRKKCIGA